MKYKPRLASFSKDSGTFAPGKIEEGKERWIFNELFQHRERPFIWIAVWAGSIKANLLCRNILFYSVLKYGIWVYEIACCPGPNNAFIGQIFCDKKCPTTARYLPGHPSMRWKSDPARVKVNISVIMKLDFWPKLKMLASQYYHQHSEIWKF